MLPPPLWRAAKHALDERTNLKQVVVKRAAGRSQDPEEGAAVMGLLNPSTPRRTNRMSHDGRDLFTERAAVAAALPKHPFYSGRTCPTCPPIKHANGHDPTARGCAMRCIGTSRGGCNLPLRDVTWLAAGQCPRCRAETAHGGPILQDVDIAGALRLATAVVEQAQKDATAVVEQAQKAAHQGSEAARVFLAQLHEPGNVVGGLIALAALRQLATPTRHAKF